MDSFVIIVEETSTEDEYYYDREYYRDDVRCAVPYCKKPRRDHRKKQYFTISGKLKESFCQMLERNNPTRALHVCEDHISIADDCYRTETGLLRLKDTASFPLLRKTSGNVGVVQPKKQMYKYCIVPECENSTSNAPDKVFFPIPRGEAVRREWCEAMKRDMICPVTLLYCCEDHFNIEEDTDNYVHYSILSLHGNKNCQLRLKKGVLPHKFQWQKHALSPERKDCKRRKHLDTIEEAPGEDPPPAKQSIRPAKISGTQEIGRLLQENTKIAQTSLEAIQELDELNPLINDENNEEAVTTTTKVKQEFEDNETEVTQAHFDTELEEEKDTSFISLEQFLKGCEFYLTPELADYVKTQIKQLIQ